MTARAARLVLVGAGHAHLGVLRNFALRRLRAEVVVVSPATSQLYSGMMPGQLYGRWNESALSVDVPSLCAAAGATFVRSSALGVNATQDSVNVQLDDGDVVEGTHASLDIGAVPSGLDIPGVREHAFHTRPATSWRALVARAQSLAASAESASGSEPAPLRCCVVGGGAAGTELALALATQLRRAGGTAAITIVSASPYVPSGLGASAARRMRTVLAERHIGVECNAIVREVTAAGVVLDDGRLLASALTLWATGAAAPPLIGASGLPIDADGFLAVDATLRAVSGVPLWGAGDCIAMASAPWMTRAGVYAVRAAPVLAHNLRVACDDPGAPTRPFVPQRHTMFILDSADGAAMLSWRGLAVHARWAQWLKARIDTRFVARYKVD